MRVTAFAKGLFSLVDSLEMGKGLSELSDTMAATIEISDLLGLGKLKEEFASVVGPNNSPIPMHTVPNDKVWRVRAWGSRVSTGAGVSTAATIIGIRLSSNAAAGQFVSALSDDATIPANSARHLVARNLPLWVPPGANLCAFGIQVGGAPSFDSHVLYEEFDA